MKGLLRHLRQRFKLGVSISGLRRALPKATFIWGRPKLVLPKGRGPAPETKLTRLNTVLAEPTATILVQDKCDMMLLPVTSTIRPRRSGDISKTKSQPIAVSSSWLSSITPSVATWKP